MTTRSVRRLAWALALTGLFALVAGVVLLVANRRAGLTGAAFAYPPILTATVATVAVLGVGLLVALRRPSNPIGWLLLALVVFADMQALGIQYAAYALLAHPGSLPGGVAVAVAVNGAWVLAILALVLMTFLFPTGRLASPRFRPFMAVAVASLGAVYVVNLFTDLTEPFADIPNPIAVQPGPALGALVAVPIIVGAPLGLLAACASLVVRFRRAPEVEREQIKWFVFAASALPALILIHLVAETFSPGAVDTVEVMFSAATALFPIAIGVAILKYRLYEIDRIISRTIVYAALSLVLAAVYAGVVLAGQAVFSSIAGGSSLAIAVSTLVAAALFLPVRSRIQRAVDRRFYRRRYDAQRTLEAFGAKLREQVDLDALGAELCGVVSQTVQPAHVTMWLRHGRRG